MPWQCAHCAKNNLGVGVYGLIRCSECGTSSPALTKCADLGLELLWVPADGDCYYHALLQAERARTNRPTNVNDAGYIMALTALRTEAAKQLTSSDAYITHGHNPQATAYTGPWEAPEPPVEGQPERPTGR